MIEERLDDHRLAFAGAARLQDDLVRRVGIEAPRHRDHVADLRADAVEFVSAGTVDEPEYRHEPAARLHDRHGDLRIVYVFAALQPIGNPFGGLVGGKPPRSSRPRPAP